MESARVAQPIHFLVFGFKDTMQNAGHGTKDFCFVVCDVNSEKKSYKSFFRFFKKLEGNLAI